MNYLLNNDDIDFLIDAVPVISEKISIEKKEARKIAMLRKEFIAKLQSGEVLFAFNRVSKPGARYAKGTLNVALALEYGLDNNQEGIKGEHIEFSQNKNADNPLLISYWDLEKKGIRNFYLDKSSVMPEYARIK